MAAFACGVVCARLWAWSLSVLAVTVLSDDSLSSFFNVVYFNMVMSTASMCVCVCVYTSRLCSYISTKAV